MVWDISLRINKNLCELINNEKFVIKLVVYFARKQTRNVRKVEFKSRKGGLREMKVAFGGILLIVFLSAIQRANSNSAADADVLNATGHIETVVPNFKFSGLSEAGQTAYQSLLRAGNFEEGYLGAAAERSSLVTAFYILSKEPNADSAFKSLLENATLAGQMYALCGLYKTDHDFFVEAVEKYRNSREEVQVASGCLIMPQKVKDLIDASDKKFYSHDILSGKYSEHFLRLGQKFLEEKKKRNAQIMKVNGWR